MIFFGIWYAGNLTFLHLLLHLIQLGGLKEGDFIVELSGVDVKWYTQHQLSKLIQNAKRSLEIKVITPIDRNYLKVRSDYTFQVELIFYEDLE